MQKYLSLTKHAYSPTAGAALEEDLGHDVARRSRPTLKECAASAATRSASVNREQAASSVANLKAKGMVVNEISPAEMPRIRDRTRPVYEQHGKAIGDEAMNLVFGELKRIRGN